MTHDREPESEAAVRASSRSIGLPKALKHVRQKVGRNAWPCIAHLDLHVSFILADANTNRPSNWGKLRSIRQKVPHDLLQSIDVARDHFETVVKLRLDADVFCFERRPDCIERGADDCDQIDWSKVE